MVEKSYKQVIGFNIFSLVDLNLLIDGFKGQLDNLEVCQKKQVYCQEYVDKNGEINVFKCVILSQFIDHEVSGYLFQATDITEIYKEQLRREVDLLEKIILWVRR